MKSDIHPNYRPVVFMDQSAEFSFITRSTIETQETIEWEDGNTYPLAKVEISSASHPFFTGTMKIVDTAGRVERFERRYGRKRKADAAAPAPEAKAPEAPTPAAEAPPVEAEAPEVEAPAAEAEATETEATAEETAE